MSRPCATPGSGTNAGGFSLFELVLVIAIIGLMAGIAIPRFADSDARYRLDAAEYRLLADAGLISERARASGTACEIEFDLAGESYTTYAGTGAGRNAITTTLLGSAPYRAEIVSTSVRGGGATLTFDGYGTAEDGASVTLRVGARSRVVVLSVDPPAAAVEAGDDDDDDEVEEEQGKGVLDILDLPGDIIGGLLG